jgi:hypothetical protein
MTAATITMKMKGQIRIVTVPAGVINCYAREDDEPPGYDDDLDSKLKSSASSMAISELKSSEMAMELANEKFHGHFHSYLYYLASLGGARRKDRETVVSASVGMEQLQFTRQT